MVISEDSKEYPHKLSQKAVASHPGHIKAVPKLPILFSVWQSMEMTWNILGSE